MVRNGLEILNCAVLQHYWTDIPIFYIVQKQIVMQYWEMTYPFFSVKEVQTQPYKDGPFFWHNGPVF